MRDRNLFNRIRTAVRNLESGTPFARGNGQFSHGEDQNKSLLHSDFLKTNTKKSPVVEGITSGWRLREEDLCMSNDGIDITPIEMEDVDLIGVCAEPTKRGLHKARRVGSGWEMSPKEARRTNNFARMGAKGKENSRGCHNFGRKPRSSTNETIRNMRQLPCEERMIAGEILRSEGEERRNRRRARACKRPLAEVLEFPTRTTPSADESAAA